MPFSALAGHTPLLGLLARASARGTLPPSLIFAGPAGVGKRAAAVALAQALNCENTMAYRDGRDACGVCAACRRIARGVHADVLLVEPGETGSIKVDQVREAIDRSAYRPFEGRRRAVIVDDADALVGEAQNALLKTLEEPPSGSVFVLITSRPDLLLPTVRSRCQQLRFGPLTAADIAVVLTRDHGISAHDAQVAAAAAGGSLGRALAEDAGEILEARDAAARLLQTAASSADPRRRLDGAKAFVGSADRDALWRRLIAAASMVRDLGLLNARGPDASLANADLDAQLRALLRSFDAPRIDRAFAAIDRALEAVDRNGSPKIVADWVALQL